MPVCLGTVRHQPEPEHLFELPPSTRWQALHRLGFTLKRPKKRLVKEDEAQPEVSAALGRLPRPELLELHHGPPHGPPGGWPRVPGRTARE